MTPNRYRLYRLDVLGRLHDVEMIYADSDEVAISCTSARHADGCWEIWDGKRLVAQRASIAS